ncbi:MAG: energy transducer TonB [Rikenellaceae bacterium]
MDKPKDIGTWTYDNRVGLLTTLIIYLILAICFIFGKIYISSQPHTQGFYVDLSEFEEVVAIRDELLKEVETKQNLDWSSVSNRVSNEQALDNRVVDDRGTNVDEINASAQSVQEQMAANREAYQEALASLERMREEGKNNNSDNSAQKKDAKIEGSVTVSYSFTNPVRHSVNLTIPAYQCEGGGDVVIEVTLNQRGVVTAATVLRGGDNCMQQSALSAAKSSRFNTDNNAPQSQRGTVTYIYIPQ